MLNLKKIKLGLCISLSLINSIYMTAQEGNKKAIKFETIDIYRTPEAPLLDGKRDEAAWENATPTKDFTLYKSVASTKRTPNNATRAWLMYDAANLYIFFECRDRDMSKIIGGKPQDKIDVSVWNEEEVEIFLDVNHDRKTYYMMACSVLGTQFDMASLSGNNWHGGRDKPGKQGWRVETHRDDKAWYAEIAIPFTVLRRKNELAATPQPGTVWGMNLYRHEIRENEWINWSPVDRSFHQPDSFGQVRFMGFRDFKVPMVEKTDVSHLDFGKHSIRCHVKNPGTKTVAIEGRLNLGIEGVKPMIDIERSKNIPPGQTAVIEFPYTIFKGGDWLADITIKTDKITLLEGQIFRRLPKIVNELREISDAVNKGNAVLINSKFPASAKKEINEQLVSLVAKTKRCLPMLAEPEKLNASQWQELCREVNTLKVDSTDCLKQITYIKADNAQKYIGSETGYLVKSYGPLKHVFPDTSAGGMASEQPIKLTAMRGESESFQLAVMSLWQNIKDVKVSISPLKGKGGNISEKDMDVFLVAYQKSELRPHDPPGTREWFPDILLPNASRNIPSYMTQPYWIDINVPRNAIPGTYKGAVTVIVPGKSSQIVSVELLVRDYVLPEVCALENDFWISSNPLRFWKYDTRSLKKMSEMMQIAKNNRISAMPSFWLEIYFKVKITRTGEDKYSFDFSEFNKFLLVAKNHGVNSWNPNLSCNQGWASYFCGGYGGVKVHDAASGKEYEFSNSYKKKTIPLKVLWTETPIFEQFWKAYVKNLKGIGMLETAWYESVDEPNDMPRIDLLIMIHGQLRKWVPELKLMSWGVIPRGHYARARGYVDAWAPQLGSYFDVRKTMLEDQNKNGIVQKVYTCGSQRRNDKGGFTPDGYVRDPNISRRIVPWMCYKWNIHGYLFYAMHAWTRPAKAKVIPLEDQPWLTIQQLRKQPVFGIVMPGKNKTLLQTIRLKTFRDGMDDYDYLKILEKLTKRLKVREDAKELRGKAEKALIIENNLVCDPYTYTLDPELLEKRRRELGELIEEISSFLKK